MDVDMIHAVAYTTWLYGRVHPAFTEHGRRSLERRMLLQILTCRHLNSKDVITDPYIPTYEVACTHDKHSGIVHRVVRTRGTTVTIVLRAVKHMTGSGVHARWMSGHHAPTPFWINLLCLLIPDSLVIFSCATLCLSSSPTIVVIDEKDWWSNWKEKRRSNEKMRRHNLWQVRNRKNVKISVNRWELKFPKDWDISRSLGNQNSQRLGIFKITASWKFNFGKYPKNNREKRRPRPFKSVHRKSDTLSCLTGGTTVFVYLGSRLYQMIVSKVWIIKSFDTLFQFSVWSSKDLIIKTKNSTIKSINTQKKTW